MIEHDELVPFPARLFQSGVLPGQGRLAGPEYSPAGQAVFAWSVPRSAGARPHRIGSWAIRPRERSKIATAIQITMLREIACTKLALSWRKEADARESGRRRGRSWDGSAAMRAGVARPRTGTGAPRFRGGGWNRTRRRRKRGVQRPDSIPNGGWRGPWSRFSSRAAP